MDKIIGIDRDGNRLQIGDTVDVLHHDDVSIVMWQAKVVGFDLEPSYCFSCIGIFISTQSGSVHPWGLRKAIGENNGT